MKKSNVTRVVLGVIFLCIALIITGNIFCWWNITDFSGWWTAFLIIPGVVGTISCGFSFWNSFLIILGVAFLSEAQGWLDFVDKRFFWVLFFAILGIWFILKPLFKRTAISCSSKADVYFDKINNTACHDDYINFTAIFGGIENRNDSSNLKGANLSSVFGGIALDLRQAKLENGATININAVFGGVKIKLPNECKVKVKGVPIFGGLTNKYIESQSNEYLPEVTIKYTALFGGIELY